jgi:hypothetical protein
VLGDVAFHVVPETSRLSIVAKTTARLRAILQHVPRPGSHVTLLAHSQGSIVALETIKGGNCPVDLVTVGAPVDSLYKRFLGYAAPHAAVFSWTNLWRTGDYIGGAISELNGDDICTGPGGHTGYWSDQRVWQQLLSSA